MKRCAAVALVLAALQPGLSLAGTGQCHVVDVAFTTADDSGDTVAPYHFRPQMVVWIEDSAGNYLDTLYMTQQTGRFGIGNRPGRFDFNSGPIWPYGRRVTTFPVWANKSKDTSIDPLLSSIMGLPKGQFPSLEYQDHNDSGLSHAVNQSSTELHFCRPLDTHETQWTVAYDNGSCATSAYTDKGRFSTTLPATGYPPRTDVTRDPNRDTVDVDMYPLIANAFDAVSQATPPYGVAQDLTWPIPSELPSGNYVVMVEVSKEFDYNGTYNATSYPAPCDTCIPYSNYGVPYRGQPSVIYKVPIAIGTTESVGIADSYAGYGDPDGLDGNIRMADGTITTDLPGSGGARLALVSDPAGSYRVKVTSRPEFDSVLPGTADETKANNVTANAATISFVAPGDDGATGKVRGYDIKWRAQTPLTDANFDDPGSTTVALAPDEPGQVQTFDLSGLLPQTDYYVGIRAYDDCKNAGPVSVVKFTTPAVPIGEVDACFVATAAYGSLMANNVGMLRQFRDAVLRSTVLGELAVEGYYTFGPALAGVVDTSDLVRETARDLLGPVVARAGAAKR